MAEDDDRSFTLTRDARGDVSGMVLELGRDRMNVQRIGPLFGAVKPDRDPDQKLTNDIRSAVDAMAAGGKWVDAAEVIAPQARKDFARWPVAEFKGVQNLSVVRSQDVSERGIKRHGADVNRVVYCKIGTKAGTRLVLFYLTKEGQITDQDVIIREVTD